MAQKIGLGHDAHDAPGAVQHRQRLDAVAAHEAPGVFQTFAELHRQRIAAHHVAAAQAAKQALIGVQLGLAQQVFQVVATDIEHFVVQRQRLVEVGGAEARRHLVCGRRPCGGPLGMGIAMAGRAMPGHAGQHQQQRVHGHRKQREREGFDAQQRHGQRYRAAGGMQAAQRQHRGRRQPNGRGCHHGQRCVNDPHTGNADQRRHGVAAHRRPRLGHGARRRGEYQNRGGTQRGHQPDAGQGAVAGQPLAEQSGQPQAQRGPCDHPQPFARVDGDGRRPQQRRQGLYTMDQRRARFGRGLR